MRKSVTMCLIMLGAFAIACSLPVFAFPTPTRLVGHHVSSLTLYDGSLYFGAGYCLYRLDLQPQNLRGIACTPNWTFQRPAVDDERTYVQILASPEAEQFFAAVDLPTGRTVWRVNESVGVGPYLRSMKDYTFLVDDLVITARGERFETEQRIYALDAQSGRRIWRSELNYYQHESVPFLIHDDLIWYAVDREKQRANNGTLTAVDLSTGQERRAIDLWPDAVFDGLLYIDDRWILGWDDRRFIFVVDRTRPDEVAWQKRWPTYESPDQIVLQDELFIVAAPDRVYALDVRTGQERWTFEVSANDSSALHSGQPVLFVLYPEDGTTLYALDAASGAAIWEYALEPLSNIYASPGSPRRPVVSGGVVYIANRDSIDALDLDTGELLWRVDIDSEYVYEHFPL